MRRRTDEKILLFRPRFTQITQKMLANMMRKNTQRREAMIIVMKDARALLYGRRKNHLSRRKNALCKKKI